MSAGRPTSRTGRCDTGRDVEILDFIDDHSRLIVAAKVLRVTKAADVVDTFKEAAETWGYPASVLTDNGAIFNGGPRKGVTVFEALLKDLGIVTKHSRPYHPQTCGKIERFHQTLKRYLDKQTPSPFGPRAPAPGRPLRHLLQRTATAPVPGLPHPAPSLRRAGQGPAR